MSSRLSVRLFVALILAIVLAGAIMFFLPAQQPERLALAVFFVTVIAWTLTPFDRTAVALVAALTLVLGGAVTEENFYRSLGHPLIWLLFGAFVIAAALAEIQLAERLARVALRPARNVTRLFYALTLMIAVTAFMIPSTTGRAAFLLPVFLTLSGSIANAAITRAMSIHFPSIILLSACGSLIGAGAHLVAIDMMREIGRAPGAYRPNMTFMEWTTLGLPFALVSSLLATFVILQLFLNREQRALPLAFPDNVVPPRLTGREIYILVVVAMTILLWLTQAVHGVEVAIVTLCSAIAVSVASPSGKSMKQTFREVDWNLLLFVAGASLIGEALIDTNAAGEIMQGFVSMVNGASNHPVLVVGLVSLVALLGHLVITSRTARATVLIPLIALPLAQFGYNSTAVIFLIAVASGYCLTLTISAKSLLIYSNPTGASFSHGELLRLSGILLPLHLALLVVFAMFIWPQLGLPLLK